MTIKSITGVLPHTVYAQLYPSQPQCHKYKQGANEECQRSHEP